MTRHRNADWGGSTGPAPANVGSIGRIADLTDESFPRKEPSSGFSLAIIFVAAIVSFAFCSCGESSDQSKSQEPEPRPATARAVPSLIALAAATPAAAKENQPPKSAEVDEAIARVFDKAASIDSTQVPSFVVGDLNGDGSEDIAVVTKINADSLAEINNELANWTLEDPRQVPIPGTKRAYQADRPKAVKADKGDLLVAIIHGVGAQGWRNREARQTFLLRNAVWTNPQVQSSSNLIKQASNSKLPPFSGDVIMETINGRHGLLFWTGAKYAWLPYH